jgi:hypothetical protein
METKLVKCKKLDIGREDHGILTLLGFFQDDDGYHYVLSYSLDMKFVGGLLNAIGVTQFRDSDNKSCWIEGNFPITGTQEIQIVRPLHKDGGTPFVIAEWQAEWKATHSLKGGAS